MDKSKLVIVSALCLIALIAGISVVQAQEVSFIPQWLAALYQGNIYTLVIGGAVIAGSYVVFHEGRNLWEYFTTNKYTTVSSHAYDIHAMDFPNIFGKGKTPSRKDWEKKCKDNMNSAGSTKYIQAYDGRLLSWNPSTLMVSVGETDGKTVITCFPKTSQDVNSKVRNGEWIKVKA